MFHIIFLYTIAISLEFKSLWEIMFHFTKYLTHSLFWTFLCLKWFHLCKWHQNSTSRGVVWLLSFFLGEHQIMQMLSVSYWIIMMSYHKKLWKTVSITISIFYDKSWSIRMWKIQMREVWLKIMHFFWPTFCSNLRSLILKRGQAYIGMVSMIRRPS